MADQMLKEVQQWLNSTYGNRSDFPKVPEDGAADVSNSRYLTYRGLVRALQIEIGGITVDGDFGISTQNACPNISQVADVDPATPNNFHYIVQGGLINKGYDPQAFSGIFGPKTAAAVKEFQSDAGVEQTGIATGWLLKGLLNTDSYTLTSNGNANYREVARTLNQYYAPQIGLTATNGEWERKMHQNLIKACQIEWGVNADGVFGTGTMNAAPTLSQSKSGYTASKRLLQCALTVNGYWPGGISGTFGSGTYQAVYDFQDFACLGADGVAGKNTWASLLKSTGNPDRTAKAIDTAVRVDAAFAQQIKGFNFDTVGRYLTNATEIDGHLDKKMTVEEIEVLANAGLKVFPIFQTSGDKIEYFTATRGKNDGVTAKSAAVRLGFPTGTAIYFAVDYDVRNTEIDSIVAYARAAKIGLAGKYKLGIYGPRYVCQTLCDKGISDYSFVSDLSSGFEGNIGHKLPDNWAYDQIKETTIYGKGVDKCVASPRASAISASLLNPVTTEIPDEPVPNEDFIEILRDIYDFTGIYNSSLSIVERNLLVLQFLRLFGPYSTLLWTVVAGKNEEFNEQVRQRFPTLEQEAISIIDPVTNQTIDMTHFSALMGALLLSPSPERLANCIEEWIDMSLPNLEELGRSILIDILNNIENVASIIGNTINFTIDQISGYGGDLWSVGKDFFNANQNMVPEDARKQIANSIGRNEEDAIPDDAGSNSFSWEDYCADIDAVNMASDMINNPIYNVIENYYLSDAPFHRTSNFIANMGGEEELRQVVSNLNANDLLLNILRILAGTYYKADVWGEILTDGFMDAILTFRDAE